MPQWIQDPWAGLMAIMGYWQTLITGIAAVLAAALTIGQSHRTERRRLRRQINAARATFPLVLSGVSEWAMEVAQLHMKIFALSETTGVERVPYPGLDAIDKAARDFPKPTVPTQLVTELKQMIEATDDEAVVRRITLMIGGIQILTSRMAGLGSDPTMTSRNQLIEQVIRAGVVYAQALSMFMYARQTTETVERSVEWDLVRTCLPMMRFREPEGTDFDLFADVLATIDKWKESGMKPGEDSAMTFAKPSSVSRWRQVFTRHRTSA